MRKSIVKTENFTTVGDIESYGIPQNKNILFVVFEIFVLTKNIVVGFFCFDSVAQVGVLGYCCAAFLPSLLKRGLGGMF